jgi:hypothetical protein
MADAAEKILAQAMAPRPDERLALAETLLESATISSDPQYTTSWEAEIDRRISAKECFASTGADFGNSFHKI